MFETILVLFIIILLSNILVRFVPVLSVPLVQVLLGAVAVMVQPHFQLNLEPHLFMLIFIGPLLFNDGMHSNKRHLWHKRKAILAMALILVIITVLGMGYLIHFLVPDISLPIAFALAAALSPTDYVAVSSLSQKIALPESISPIIEGEGLINDATGLVSFKFTLAAAISGTFSLWQAELNFLAVAIGGALVGAMMQLLIFKLEKFIAGLGMEDIAIEVILHLLTPFVIYLVAEEIFSFSGVLAVVAAGMLYTSLHRRQLSHNEKISEMKDNVWSVLVVVLNGLVFTLVGLHLPEIIREYLHHGRPLFWDILNVLLISIALYGLRFLWVLYLYDQKLGKKDAVLTTLSGVRGAVTLATVLSVPAALTSTIQFPVRELLLFYAVGVIMVTMLVATLLLPRLAKKDRAIEVSFNEKLKQVQAAIWQATIGELETEEPENVYAQALIAEYRNRLLQLKSKDSEGVLSFVSKESRQLKLKLLKLEYEYVEHSMENGEVDESLGGRYLQMVEKKISLLSRSNRYKAYLKRIGQMTAMFSRVSAYKGKRHHPMEAFQELHCQSALYIIDYLKDNLNEGNAPLYRNYIQYYAATRVLPSQVMNSDFNNQELKKYKVKSLQLERNTIQHFYEEGKINWNIASTLRKTLNYAEAEILRDM